MIRFIAAALIGLVLGTACAEEEGPDASPDGRRDVVCEGCTEAGLVDFGVPAVGERVDRVVRLRNRGDAPALLRAIQASTIPPGFVVQPVCTVHCGFHELAPGRALELTISYRPTEEGRTETTLPLGPDGPNLRLVAQAGRFGCMEALDFGSVVRGRERSLALDCENTTDGPRSVTFGPATGENAGDFQVETRTLDLKAFESASAEVTFAPTGALGPRDGRLPVRVGSAAAGEVVLSGVSVDRALQIPAVAAGCVELGFQQLGSRLATSLEVVNVTHEPIPVTTALAPGSDPAFSTSQEALQLEPGASAALAFAFEPQAAGVAEAELRIEAGGELHAVCVRGTGVGPALRCDRDEVDFGLTDVATPRSIRLQCRNAAEDVAGTDLDRLVIEGASTGVFAVVEPDGRPALGYAPGETFDLEVRFEPTAVGLYEASIRTNDPSVSVPLRGEAGSYPDCTLDAATTYDFGRVTADEARHPFFLTNTGSGDCLVGDFRVTMGNHFSAAPAFGSFVIPAGETAAIELRFESDGSAATAVGEVSFWTSDAGGSQRTIGLQARAGTSCLEIQPGEVEFDGVMVGCTSRALEVEVRNLCANPVSILMVDFVGHADAFSVGGLPPVVPALGVETIEVEVHPSDTAPRHGAIRILIGAFPEPIIVPLRAQPTTDAVAVETHTVPRSAVDILFVIEDAQADSPEMWLHADTFFDELGEGDWQIGVTTTSVGDGYANGRLVPVDGSSPRIITPALSHAARKAALHANASVGWMGNSLETPLAAMKLALSSPLIDSVDDLRTTDPHDGNAGFLRSHADLAVVFLIEEPDSSPGTTADYVNFLRGLKRGQAVPRMHLVEQIPGHMNHSRMKQAVAATGGKAITDHVSYGPTPEFNEALVAAIAPRRPGCFALRHAAAGGPGEGGISLRLNGVALPATSAVYPWFFDTGENMVCFSGSIPLAGSELEIAYTKACL